MKTFHQLRTLFGLWPANGLHDLDLPDDSAAWPPSLKDPVSRPELRALKCDIEASTLMPCTSGVDGPAAQGGEASAAGHPNMDWAVIREGMAELRSVLVDALAWLDEIDPVAAGLATSSIRD